MLTPIISSEIFKQLIAHYTTAINYSPLPPCFLQAQVPDFIVCIKSVCFNMNKYSVTVQLDLANNPQQDSWFALMEPRKVSLAQPLPTM